MGAHHPLRALVPQIPYPQSCKYFLNTEKSWDSFYNFPVGQSTSLESRFSLGFHVCGHLSPNHPPEVIDKPLTNLLLSYPSSPFSCSFDHHWFQPHLLYFPWPAGSESWPHSARASSGPNHQQLPCRVALATTCTVFPGFLCQAQPSTAPQ